MDGELLLDTSAFVELFRGGRGTDRLAGSNDRSLVSVIVIGELLAGALRSDPDRREKNVAQVERLAAGPDVIDCDAETARHYASIRDRLRLKGRPIPENDMWIAATALQHQLTLATRDAHFREVEGLVLLEW
jgi:tRNA(fMet)-specific endonuclease VapC